MEQEMKLDNIDEIAISVINESKKLSNEKARIIALDGDLGAGKTTLTKAICKILGIKKDIISPTFVIMKYYNLGKSKGESLSPSIKRLIHIDAYRLNNADELLKLGFDEISKNKENLIIIEWGERVRQCLGNNVLNIKLNHKDENTRTIQFLV